MKFGMEADIGQTTSLKWLRRETPFSTPTAIPQLPPCFLPLRPPPSPPITTTALPPGPTISFPPLHLPPFASSKTSQTKLAHVLFHSLWDGDGGVRRGDGGDISGDEEAIIQSACGDGARKSERYDGAGSDLSGICGAEGMIDGFS